LIRPSLNCKKTDPNKSFFALLSAKQSTYGVTAFVNESLQFNGPASNIWAALSNARWSLSVQADVARAETEEFVREIIYDYQIVKNACCDEYCIRASSGYGWQPQSMF
jgi:hypothetical protein